MSRYLDVLYHERRLDLISELISNPTWRHSAREVAEPSLADTSTRLEDTFKPCPELQFDVSLLYEG